ncbi:MAG: methyltransferase domain-containing protein [Bacillota bacterium]
MGGSQHTEHIDDPIALFREAENLLKQGKDQEAGCIYRRLIAYQEAAPLALFRLGEISNRAAAPMQAMIFHREAFRRQPSLAARIVPESAPSRSYIYSPVKEVQVTACPLCSQEGTPYSVYNMVTNVDFIPGFDPVRVWMRCRCCGHLYASAYPAHLDQILSQTSPVFHAQPKPALLPMLGKIMSRLVELSPGHEFLEVGVGAGEMAAVAKEFLLSVTGLDIRPLYAQHVREMLGQEDVYAVDFLAWETSAAYDLICMGDVIEHMAQPRQAITKARQLLNPDGILWISTPNYESAFSMMLKDRDPMWRVCEHLNYFSYRSLKDLLAIEGFSIVDYQVSGHYNGSMEVTARKR